MSIEREIPEKSLVIETEEQSEAAMAEIFALLDKGKDRTPEETERLKLLSDAEAKYEAIMYPPEYVSPAELLEHLMECNSLNVKKMSKQSGVSQKRLKAILKEGAAFTADESARVARRFCLRRDCFLEQPNRNSEET